MEVANTTEKFLKAFKDFDWETFRNYFDDEASIFFPAQFRTRKLGRKEIEAAWKEIFPEFIDPSKKFDLKLNPQSLLIQMHGKLAIVTFHMGENSDYLSRRTIVLKKEKGVWKIVHLHASGLKE
ncbi:YybH family protein [Flavobacterium caeni]|uniref:YybH family protein n=1 Tax=Flavobacterium caeni TaxID=490189 RepID=UPI000B888D2B|nr:nuclear transport factor 2 family protein [Flavobacterium caeni]